MSSLIESNIFIIKYEILNCIRLFGPQSFKQLYLLLSYKQMIFSEKDLDHILHFMQWKTQIKETYTVNGSVWSLFYE